MRPLCASLQSITGHAIWADQRGVFSAVSGVATGLALDDVPDDDAGVVVEEDLIAAADIALRTRVFHNEGSGWSLRANLRGTDAVGLTAASAAKLIVYGSREQLGDTSCALAVLSGDMLECNVASPVRDAFAVSETRAFALAGSGHVLEHDGQGWTQRPVAFGGRAIWADDDELIVASNEGVVQRLIADVWVPEKVGSAAALTAVWGHNGGDLWVGDAEGRLLHFDGAGWQLVGQLGGVTCARQEPIMRIAGAGAHVWIHTPTQLARWNGSELESFGNWSCAPLRSDESSNSLRIEDLSVVDEDNVFIAFLGGAVTAGCGDAYVVHFDGSAFHRF